MLLSGRIILLWKLLIVKILKKTFYTAATKRFYRERAVKFNPTDEYIFS